MDWRYDNTSDAFSIRIGDFIALRGIALVDILEAQYLVKTSKLDADANALVTLAIGSGITTAVAAPPELETLTIQFSTTDFDSGKLDITECTKEPYYAGLGIKTAGMTKFLEIDLVDNRLEIIQDFIHD